MQLGPPKGDLAAASDNAAISINWRRNDEFGIIPPLFRAYERALRLGILPH